MLALRKPNSVLLILLQTLYLLLPVLLLSACTWPGKPPFANDSCSSDGDCNLGYQCDNGYCQMSQSDVLQDTVHEPDTSSACGEPCGEHESCNAGRCGSVMTTIPGGPFMMGCNTSIDDDCETNEYPYHEVTVPEFKIDVTEVTVGQYRACFEDNGSCSEPRTWTQCNWAELDRENHPINCINWYQSKDYCEWVDKRLCSESEWEKAARGTDGRIYPWGNETPTCEWAVMSDEVGSGCGDEQTWPVGSKPVGLFGLYDMSGNVYEWVEDDQHLDYDGVPDNGEAWIENPRSAERVVRGGSLYNASSAYLRASSRHSYTPNYYYYGIYGIGARCCSSTD